MRNSRNFLKKLASFDGTRHLNKFLKKSWNLKTKYPMSVVIDGLKTLSELHDLVNKFYSNKMMVWMNTSQVYESFPDKQTATLNPLKSEIDQAFKNIK